MCVTAQAQQAVMGDGSVNTEQKKEKENRQQEYKEICPKDSNSVGSAKLLWKCSREYAHPPPSVSQLRSD